MEYLKKDIGRRIRALRKLRGWSQEELASRSGRSVYTLSLLERGVNLPNLMTLVDLAKAFQCALDDLVSAEGDASASSKSAEQRAVEAQIHVQIASMDLKTLRAAQGAIKAILEVQG